MQEAGDYTHNLGAIVSQVGAPRVTVQEAGYNLALSSVKEKITKLYTEKNIDDRIASALKESSVTKTAVMVGHNIW